MRESLSDAMGRSRRAGTWGGGGLAHMRVVGFAVGTFNRVDKLRGEIRHDA